MHAHGRMSGLTLCVSMCRLLPSAFLFSLFNQHFHHCLMNEFSSQHCADDVFICCVSASILFIELILSSLLWSLFTVGWLSTVGKIRVNQWMPAIPLFASSTLGCLCWAEEWMEWCLQRLEPGQMIMISTTWRDFFLVTRDRHRCFSWYSKMLDRFGKNKWGNSPDICLYSLEDIGSDNFICPYKMS